MAYHVIYFGEDPFKQMDSMFKIVTPADWNHDRLVLDLEVQETTQKKNNSNYFKVYANYRAKNRKISILYSRASWVNQYLNV